MKEGCVSCYWLASVWWKRMNDFGQKRKGKKKKKVQASLCAVILNQMADQEEVVMNGFSLRRTPLPGFKVGKKSRFCEMFLGDLF